MNTRMRCDTGQGIVEYILVTAVVALAALGIFRAFRADVKEAYQKAGSALVQGVEDNTGSGASND